MLTPRALLISSTVKRSGYSFKANACSLKRIAPISVYRDIASQAFCLKITVRYFSFYHITMKLSLQNVSIYSLFFLKIIIFISPFKITTYLIIIIKSF